MAPTRGILYVTMAPQPSLTSAQFHDWYQNEHGPGRLRLPQTFTNGFRYKAIDGASPEWMAVYDVTNVDHLVEDEYASLRKSPKQSQRERDTIGQVKVNRKFYDLYSERKGEGWKEMEKVGYEGHKGYQMVAVVLTLKPGADEEELHRWMEEEHVPMLSKVPGFRRARRFVSSHVEPLKDGQQKEYIALYEYDLTVTFKEQEFKDAVNTPWRTKLFNEVIQDKARRVYELCYTFGPAPRDLASLADSSTSPWSSDFHRSRTYPAQTGGWPAIESVITTSDGAPLHYRLEGSSDPQAPLIVLDNSVLTSYEIWDGFIKAFFSDPANSSYRILRFNKRGRYSAVGTEAVTVDLLAKDIITLLDGLRIPKAAAVIGVSLGGATALNVALKYPNRVAKFIASDTNPFAPPSNSKAWDERIATAEKTGATTNGEIREPIVGDDLAEVTVRRWFVPESYDDPSLAKEAAKVKAMVSSNSLEGFRKGVKALYSYDMRDDMKTAIVPGAFVVGAGDGVLPKGMRQMNEDYAGESEFYEIPNAGHLPMVEQPEKFAEVVTKVLRSELFT